MGQSLIGGLVGGVSGAISGFITGGPAKALALGVVGFIGGFASNLLAKSNAPEAPNAGAEPKFGGYTVNRRGAALHHQVIYGQTKIGGVIVFDDAHGANNKNLSRIIAFAGHKVNSFEKIYMGQYELTLSGDSVTSAQKVDENGNAVGSPTNQFNNYIKIRQVLGNHTASLNGTFSSFSSEWTTSHRLLGIAHLAIVFTYEDDVWDEGLPEITALIKGKEVYDPRTSTTAWSDNPALIVRDFLTNDEYGLGEDADNIDDTLISTAANVCEESVDVTDPDNPPAVITADRYTCNGAWTTSQAPVDVVSQLMTSCAGYLWYAQGQWRLKAGEYIAPSISLDEGDLRSPLSVATRHSRRDNFNAVRGTFKGPKTNYQFTDYPTATSSTFVTTDGGLESTLDLTLPFTDTPEEAQRLANIALEKNRSQITVTGSFGLKAFELQIGDNVSLTNARFGWSSKLFEVVSWSLSFEDYELLVNLVLRETTTTTYDEFQDVSGFESDNTNLPGALGEVVVDAGVTETDDVTGLLATGQVREVIATWSNPINNSFNFTRIYWNTSSTKDVNQYFDETGETVKFTYSPTTANPTVTIYVWAQAFDTSNNALGAEAGPVNAETKQAETTDIVDNAVSEQESALNSANTSVGTSFVTVAQTTIANPTGADILLQFSATVDADNGDLEYEVRLVRGSTVIWQQLDIPIDWSSADRQMIAANYRDVGASTGNNTYYLQVRKETGSGSGTLQVENRMLIATELKK